MADFSSLDGAFNKTVLPNGIRVISENVPGMQSISLGVWVDIGSRNENRRNNGISHFIEHMVFKGTKKRNTFEIAMSLESVGGSLNAFTGKEATCYIAHILPKYLRLAIDVLAELVQNPVFDEREMEKEKNVVREEIVSLGETPEELVHEYFQEALFPGHPLGYSILGTHETVKHFTREMVVEYWKKYYVSNGIVVAAAGNVDHEQVIRWCTKYFSKSLGKMNHPRRLNIDRPVPEKIISRQTVQSHVCIGNRSVSYLAPEKYPLMIMGTILGGGMSSRLFQNIREKYGMAYSIYSFSEFLSDCGFFGIYLSTEPEKIPKAIQLIRREFTKIREKPLSAKELREAKVQLEGNLILGMENSSSRMARIAKMEIHLGEYIPLIEVIDAIKLTASDEILEIANKTLKEKTLQTTMLVPEA